MSFIGFSPFTMGYHVPVVPAPAAEVAAGSPTFEVGSNYRIRRNDGLPDVEGNIDTDPEGPAANLWVNMRYEGFGTAPTMGINTNSYFFKGELIIYIPVTDLGNYTITPEANGGNRRRHRRKTKHRRISRKIRRSLRKRRV